MGNEGSAEGGDGALAGLPAGLAPDGKGGFIQMSSGVEADLSSLSEEERKQLVAAMAKAQSRQVEARRGAKQRFINECSNDNVHPFSARALVLVLKEMCCDRGFAGWHITTVLPMPNRITPIHARNCNRERGSAVCEPSFYSR